MAVTKEEQDSLRKFQERLLPLDFYKDIVDDQRIEKKIESGEVPLHFTDEQQYIKILEPLFMEEVKMQIHRSKQTEMHKESEEAEVVKWTRAGDRMIRLDLMRLNSGEISLKYYSQNDLVLLSQEVKPLEETDSHMLGLVENSVFDTISVVVIPGDLKGAKPGSRPYLVTQAIKAQKTWHLTKVSGMVTALREFWALQALPRIPVRSLIINAVDKISTPTADMQAAPAVAGLNEDGGAGADAGQTEAVPKPVKENANRLAIPDAVQMNFDTKYNASQLKAIDDSRKIAGITLVQGPPGTGKTTTILGILGMLLNASTTISKGVSYSRTDKKGSLADAATKMGESSESEPEPEEVIQERKRRRVERLRTQSAWNKPGYVPWADAVEQQLPGSGSEKRVHRGYKKIDQREITSMSEIREEERPQKVLVCAPSNAAIDEVLRRAIKEGIINAKGVLDKPSITRVGPNLHSSLFEYSLEKEANRRKQALPDMKHVNVYEDEKFKIMSAARIVCATLSISGSRDLVCHPCDFDTVIIDEASQGVELSTLVPLKLGCRRLILVGDPKQLPATCFSAVALAHHYDRSLFQRLQSSQYKVNMLEEQFRMHPAISAFPSKHFYDGMLKNVREQEDFEKAFPAPWSRINCFGPVTFFHLKGSMTKSKESLRNEDEADFVLQLYQTLPMLYPPESSWRSRIAVISPYAEQVELIRSRFRTLFGLKRKDPCPVDVNTVDGFQGREKDIIIVSVVRANPKGGIGFVTDRRRMNVAFTRARLNLWVVGHAGALQQNEDWAGFIEMQQERCRFLNVTRPFESFLPRYLISWYDRHPEEEKPDIRILDKEAVEAMGNGGDGKGDVFDGAYSEVEAEEGFVCRDVEAASDAEEDEAQADRAQRNMPKVKVAEDEAQGDAGDAIDFVQEVEGGRKCITDDPMDEDDD